MNSKTALLPFTASWISLAAANPAIAQEAAASDQGNSELEIVVTAQKRSERLQDVPLSISVASQEQLERQQVNTVNDLARVAPALEVQGVPGQSVGGGGLIRGLGTQSFSAGAVASVGIVVDQVSQGNANIGDLFDVSRVEVLKGPQGTLFGLTTSAGVINITTNAPDPSHFSARARTELSDAGTAGSKFGRQVIQGVVNVPVADNAALRVSGNVNLTQGVNINAENDKLDKYRTYGVRGRFLWEPTDKITVNLIGDYTRVRDTGQDFFTITRAQSADTQAALGTCGITASAGNQYYCSGQTPRTRNDLYGGSAQIDYDAGPFTLSSISAYRELKQKPSEVSIFRLDAYPLQIINGPQLASTGLFTQEFRVASPSGAHLEYTAGAFYSRQRSTAKPWDQSISLSLGPVVIPLANNSNPLNVVRDEQMAVFGQATFHATDAFSLILGGRYTEEKLTLNQFFNDGSTLRQATLPDNFSWKAGARYEFSRRLNVYGFVAKGYKGPQISAPTDPTIPATIINPELPTSYEIGAKGSLFDNRLNFDLSAFYIKLKNFQGQFCQDGAAGTLVCSVTNVSQITSKGIEASLFGQPLPGLQLNGGLMYNEVLYPEGYLDPNGESLSKSQVTFAPKWKATFSAEYQQSLTNNLNAFIAGDAVYKSRIRFNTYADKDVTYKGHFLVGGRLGVHGPDDKWTVSAFVRNLFNQHEPVTIYPDFPGSGDLGAIYTPQSYRQVGLSFDMTFN